MNAVEEIRADVTTDLIDQGYAEAEARAAVARSSEPVFSKMYAEALGWLKQRANSSGNRAIESQQLPKEKAVMKSATKEKRICPGFERQCTTQIGPRRSLCGTCYSRKNYREHHPNAKFRGRKPAAAAASSQAPAARKTRKPNASRTLPLQVSEEVVNRFLIGLPFEDKVALAQSWLQTEYEARIVTHSLAGRVGTQERGEQS